MVGTRVRIPWKKYNDIITWNETCILAVEKFGLPGDKYQTHSTKNYIDFYFKDERDAILFQLMI